MNFYPHIQKSSRKSHKLRQGSAPLEMVLVAPLLVAMFVLVQFIGNYMIGQAYVVTEARNEAWHKRYTEAESKEYDFEGPAGFVDAEVTQERRNSSLVRLFPNPKSRHLVIGDAWHATDNGSLPKARQRAQQLNKHWNLKLQIELAKLGGSDTIDQALSDLYSLKSLADRIMDMIRNMIAEQLNPFKDSFEELKAGVEAVKQKLEEKLEAEKQKTRDRIEELDQEIQQLEGEIQAEKDRVQEIEKQIADSEALDDDDEDKLTDKEIEDLQKRMKKIEEDEIPRLEKEQRKRQRERDIRRQILEKLDE